MEGRPATASPHVGSAVAEAPLQWGGPLWPVPLQGVANRRRQQPTSGQPVAGAAPARRPLGGRSIARCQRLARKVLLARGEAAGATPARGYPAVGRRPQRHRLRARRRPQERLPAGKGSRCLRRGNGDSDIEGEYGVRASFGEKDDPAPMNSENSEDCPHPVIICNYIERRSGSVEVTTGPTMSWREIRTHGDTTIQRNR
ncbi:hypothetical protein GW17_00054180 [Ensete ventricosum]|nr:hypothetical protein GW17_00054180 [Ensete ventricosum]